ncbi:MAG: DegT/DnrJ/EryC1/StrS aminotransferase family protein [Spirochaetales bacterium]|nr:DegT/DnrJ/EryC1/StrS aminotransferase family protein [Spirochaetales bacterium]
MIPIFKPTIKRKHMDSVLTCMVSEEIGPGNRSHQFELKMSAFLNLSGGLAFSSYYNALRIALDIIDVKPSDHIILSSLSPQIYGYLCEENGFIPLTGDVEPETGTLSVDEVEKLLPRQPKAILLHSPLGFLPDFEGLSQFGIPVIEDISQSFGNRMGEDVCGTFGDIAVLSLASSGIVTSGDGGIILTKHKSIYRKIKEKKERIPRDLLLSDIAASLGMSQLKDADAYISRRKEIERVFSQAIMKSSHTTLKQKLDAEPGFYSFPVVLNGSMNDVRKYALKKNIETQPAFLDSIISLTSAEKGEFPHAKNLLLRCLLFPLYPMLGNKNIDLIARVLSTLP